jgi:UDP-N-acetylglucosamine 2-epimerase (non-hydrolysing)
VIDALHMAVEMPFDLESSPLAGIPWEKKVILVTAHRRENFGRPLENICAALKKIANQYWDEVHLVYPVHPNPNVINVVYPMLEDVPNISLLEPLDYLPTVHLMKRSYFVLTDSGGIQEEAPGLGKPVLVLRDKTERPEGVKAGTTKLIGTDKNRIIEGSEKLLKNHKNYQRISKSVNPYGDGQSANRIANRLLNMAFVS